MSRGREDGELPCVPCPPVLCFASGISSLGSALLFLSNIFCDKVTGVIQCFSDFSAVQAGYQIPGEDLGIPESQLLSQKSLGDLACVTGLSLRIPSRCPQQRGAWNGDPTRSMLMCCVQGQQKAEVCEFRRMLRGSSQQGIGPVAHLCIRNNSHQKTSFLTCHLKLPSFKSLIGNIIPGHF